MYQSVLRKLEWGETRGSPFLQALKAASRDSGILSIKFNLDGYNMTNGDPEFSRGRMVGTIGPASSDEPVCFVAGRQFMPTAAQTQINSCVAKVDPTRSKIYLDLGNALPTVASGGTLSDLGVLSLGWIDDSTDPATTKPIDDIPYLNPNWYEQTAGVIELPANRSLTAAELAGIQQNQLVLLLTSPGGQPTPAISESPNGVYVRADQFVFRLNPGESATVTLIATQFGQRYSGARIISMLDSSQVLPFSPLSKKDASMPLPPPSASPIDAVEFPCRVMADKNGVAKLKIRAHAPGNPRGYIDGQVYGVRPVLEETIFMAGGPYPFNPGNIISVLIWDGFKPDNPPTWHGSIQPIFQQYANLYPVMGRFLNMADYEAVCANRRLMLLAFGLDPIDPNSMPVTRDLSGDKRKAILRWLTQVGRDGRPRKGTPRKAAKLSARKTALQMANGPSAVPQTRQFKYRPNPKNKPSRH
jgi:hypothetical protein